MTNKTATLVPAYGRDYKSKAAVMADWEADKDFRMEPQGCYVNKTQTKDLIGGGFISVNFRYSKLQKVFPYTLK